MARRSSSNKPVPGGFRITRFPAYGTDNSSEVAEAMRAIQRSLGGVVICRSDGIELMATDVGVTAKQTHRWFG